METIEKFIDATFKNGLTSFLLTSAGLVLCAFILSKLINGIFKRRIKNKKTNLPFVLRIIDTTLYALAFIGILMQIKPIESFMVSLLAGSGIAVVILGFAAQEAMSNVVGGIFITMFHPFKTGDLVKISEQDIIGTIEDISLRHTVIRTYENNRVIVPNSKMNSSVLENMSITDARVCNFMKISVDRSADVELALSIIAGEAEGHPGCLDARTEKERQNGTPRVTVRCTAWGEYAFELTAFLWTQDIGAGYVLMSDLRRTIKKRFAEEGIALPAAPRAIVLTGEKNGGV